MCCATLPASQMSAPPATLQPQKDNTVRSVNIGYGNAQLFWPCWQCQLFKQQCDGVMDNHSTDSYQKNGQRSRCRFGLKVDTPCRDASFALWPAVACQGWCCAAPRPSPVSRFLSRAGSSSARKCCRLPLAPVVSRLRSRRPSSSADDTDSASCHRAVGRPHVLLSHLYVQ